MPSGLGDEVQLLLLEPIPSLLQREGRLPPRVRLQLHRQRPPTGPRCCWLERGGADERETTERETGDSHGDSHGTPVGSKGGL